MEAKIRNLKGIIAADITIDRVAIVSGTNGSGKSSIAQALQALLTGNPIPKLPPHTKMNREDLKTLVHDGQTVGSVILSDEAAGMGGVSLMMAFPDGKLTTVGGKGLQLSPTAAGIEEAQLPNLKPADRAALLVSMLAAIPAKADLAAFFKDNDVANPGYVDKVWGLVEAGGWDGAFAKAEGTGRELKGQWTEASGGETWGIDKGVSWRPGTWRPDLDGLTVELASKRLEEAQAGHVKVLAAAAVSHDKRQEIGALADIEPVRKLAMTKAEAAEATALRAYQAARTAFDDDIKAMPAMALKCPNCGMLLTMDGEHLNKAEKGLDVAAFREMKATLDNKHRLSISEAEEKKHAAHNDAVAAREAYAETLKAAEKLKGMGTVSPSQPEVSARESLGEVQEAQSNLVMVTAVARCSQIHGKLRINDVIKRALAPSGLRFQAIKSKLAAFNAEIKQLSDSMGSPEVVIHEDMGISVGDRLYRDVSDSEQFRARCVMQVATALRQQTPFVVIDNDVDMDSRWYAGLLKMLLGAKVHAVVSVRCDAIKNAINPQNPKAPLAIQQLVRNYWLDGGHAHLVKPPTVG